LVSHLQLHFSLMRPREHAVHEEHLVLE